MLSRRRTQYNSSRCSFRKLCDLVMTFSYPYEDLAELIEDKGFEECSKGNADTVLDELAKLSRFFEEMEGKNEENVRDMADIYLLAGEFCQCIERFEESIPWFKKAIIVDDIYDVPYHSLAFSCLKLNETDEAIRCLEQEIKVAPGNYYTYLFLTDLYEKLGKYEDIETVLRNLLSRDSNNIQGLHKLICFYEKHNPELDVEFLRRRLINAEKELINLDLIIWTFHMCETKRYDEAIRFLDERENQSVGISITHLLKAHINGVLRQYVQKRNELQRFRKLNHGREEFMRTKLEEFSKVFSNKAGASLERKLAVTKLTSR